MSCPYLFADLSVQSEVLLGSFQGCLAEHYLRNVIIFIVPRVEALLPHDLMHCWYYLFHDLLLHNKVLIEKGSITDKKQTRATELCSFAPLTACSGVMLKLVGPPKLAGELLRLRVAASTCCCRSLFFCSSLITLWACCNLYLFLSCRVGSANTVTGEHVWEVSLAIACAERPCKTKITVKPRLLCWVARRPNILLVFLQIKFQSSKQAVQRVFLGQRRWVLTSPSFSSLRELLALALVCRKYGVCREPLG